MMAAVLVSGIPFTGITSADLFAFSWIDMTRYLLPATTLCPENLVTTK